MYQPPDANNASPYSQSIAASKMSSKHTAYSESSPQATEAKSEPRPTPEQARAARARRRKRMLRRSNCGNSGVDVHAQGKFRSDTAQEPLTTRVCGLLAKCGEESLDLNEVAKEVGANKRRVYDVKIVLEALGQVAMASRGRIKRCGEWEGAVEEEEGEGEERTRIERELRRVDAEIEKCVERLQQNSKSECYISEKLVQSLAGELEENLLAVTIWPEEESGAAGSDEWSNADKYLLAKIEAEK